MNNNGFYNQIDNNYGNNVRKNKKGILLVVLVFVVVVCIFGYFILLKPTKETEENTNNTSSEVTVDPSTNLTYDETGAFLMFIEDVGIASGRTTVTGTIVRGTVKINDSIQVIGFDEEVISTTVVSIKKSQKEVASAKIGDEVVISLKNASRENVKMGQVLAKPNSIIAGTKFDADVYVLTKEEGGRHTPFFSNYRPQFYLTAISVTGVITLPEDVKMVMPGDDTSFTVNLETAVAMEVGMEIRISEGGRTVATGTITRIYE